MADWQDPTQWQAPPLFAGSVAVTGAFQTLVAAGALGSYQNMLCYVSPGGASGVQLTFVYTLADTGAGVVSFSRSIFCPPGIGSIFTVPALTNQVRITVLSAVNVAADIAIWPTNHASGFGFPSFNGVIAGGNGLAIAGGALINTNLPVFGGRARLFLTIGAGPSSVSVQAIDLAGVFTAVPLFSQSAIAAGVPVVADLNMPLTWCTLSVLNGGAATTYNYSLVSEALV